MLKRFLLILLFCSDAGARDPILFDYSTDRALMSNIRLVGKLENGWTIYSWEWNDEALREDARYGLSPKKGGYAPIGLIAQEIRSQYPNVVYKNPNGSLAIDVNELAKEDQFLRWKISSTAQTLAGRCAKVLGTRYIFCF